MASWNNERIIPVFRDGQPEVARTNQASSNVSQGRQPNVQNVPFRNSLLVDPQEAMRKMQEQQMNFMSNWNPVDNDEFIQQFTNMMRFSPTVMTSPSPSLWLPSMSPLSTQQQPSGQGFQAPPMEPQGQYSANQGMTSSTPWRASGNVQVQPTSQPSQPSFQNSMKVEKPIQVKAQPPMRPAPPAPHSGMQPGFRPSQMEDKVQPAAVPAYQPSPPASWSPSIEKPFTPPMGNQGNSKTSSPLAYYNATATPFRSNLGSQTPSTPSTGSPKAFISPANLDMASEKGISPPITRPLYQPPLVSQKQPNHSPDIVPFKPVSPLVTYSNQPPPLVRQSSELRTQSPAPNATSGWNPEGDKEKFLDSVLSSMNFSPPVDSSNGSSRQAENFSPQVAPPAQDLLWHL
ncbi:hypothetical protein HDE_11563 [Halotydeus destructor]|nr:hypothetical protein HDE_11563 [Halotydeus destructor]